MSSAERQTLLAATWNFVDSVRAQSGQSTAELAKTLLHDGRNGKHDNSTTTSLSRNWCLLSPTSNNPRNLSRRRLRSAILAAAEVYGWRDDCGVLELLECSGEYIEQYHAAVRRHDEKSERLAAEQWRLLTRELITRFGKSEAELLTLVRKLRQRRG